MRLEALTAPYTNIAGSKLSLEVKTLEEYMKPFYFSAAILMLIQ